MTLQVVKLQPGNIVTGNMTQHSDGSWTCTGAGQSSAALTLHYAGTNKEKLCTRTAVLTAYHVYTDARYYPGSGFVAFSKTQLEFDGRKAFPPFKWDMCVCPSDPSCGTVPPRQMGTWASERRPLTTVRR